MISIYLAEEDKIIEEPLTFYDTLQYVLTQDTNNSVMANPKLRREGQGSVKRS